MLFVNDDRTVGFGADVQEGGDFVVEKLHPGEYTFKCARMKRAIS